MKHIFWLMLWLSHSFANPVVNVYSWSSEVPKKLIQQFEQASGITVNFSTYDSNETLYAKLKSSKESIYDVILPSGYYVERLRKQQLLQAIDPGQLPNARNIDAFFLNNEYDPHNQFSVPYVWGTSGLFYNSTWTQFKPTHWSQLWQQRWRNQLMLLDDPREIFSMALLALQYSPNDTNPKHIKAAYQYLLQLIVNIKLFASDGVQAIMIDEDAHAGIMWNSDAYKAHTENPNIQYVYPAEGFVIWVDCFAIPKNPPHLQAAYQFINFMLKATSGAYVVKDQGLATTNTRALALLPPALRDNPTIFPSKAILARGVVQRDIGEAAIELYNQYWQQLKLAF